MFALRLFSSTCSSVSTVIPHLAVILSSLAIRALEFFLHDSEHELLRAVSRLGCVIDDTLSLHINIMYIMQSD